MQRPEVMVSTIKVLCRPEEISNPNAVKVVTGKNGRALYFSRSTVPFDRDKAGNIQYFKHLGMYAYRKPALDRFCALPESKLEAAERLEQLRLLENGIDIYVEETPFNTVEVDTEEDLVRVQEMFNSPG
jgi:3-deoxy-manno-octulosonate cytidylyltransferase (CMP-KDO synthetase)